MFPKKSSHPQFQSPGNRSVNAPGFSILGPDTAIRGDINAESDLHIEGSIEGDVTCATLVQGEASEIIGAVSAGSARLAGRVWGTISAGDLVILKSARIAGDVYYDALTIEPGAQVDGRISIRAASQGPGSRADGSIEPLLLVASSAL